MATPSFYPQHTFLALLPTARTLDGYYFRSFVFPIAAGYSDAGFGCRHGKIKANDVVL
jgi:hypothetical protein